MVKYRDRVVGIERVKARDLVPHPANWRTHPKAQSAALRGVLDEVGIAGALLAYRRKGEEKLTLIDGHLRAGARPNQEWPVIVLDVTDEEAKYLLATHDPLAAMAQANQDRMLDLLASVKTQSQAVKDMLEALANGETQPLLNPVVDVEPRFDEAEALREKWGVERGQVWTLGEHRLMCGDCTEAGDVDHLLSGARPLLCVTDPPYGVDYDPAWRNVEAAKGNLAYAARRVGPVTADDRADWRATWKLFPGDVIYSWHPAGATSLVHAAALQDSGFVLRMQIIWAKSNFPIGRGDYHVRHEPCWYAVREGRPAQRTDDRTQTTLWEINLDRNVAGGHSTQKPLECMERPIRNHRFVEVYDPFLGSGTTIIAAERLGRRCFALDIEPKYVAVSLQRWADATGKTPVLA